MTLLTTLHIGYGVLNQKQYIYLAEGLAQGERELVRRRERPGGASGQRGGV